MSVGSTGASLHTVSRAGVAAARWLRRPEARRVIGAGSETVTTGDGIGLRSGGFEPSRSPPAPRALACPEPIQGYASVWVCSGAPVLSVLRRSGRRVRPPPGRRGAQPSPRPRESFRLDRSVPAHTTGDGIGLDRSGSGRVGVAVFTHNRRTRPRRGGRRCHHRVPSSTPRRASSSTGPSTSYLSSSSS